MLRNYLVNEYPLVLMPTLAKHIGLNEAILLQQINYWLSKKKHFYDGQYWTYNTHKEWLKQFPFFSESTLRRTIKNLEDNKILISNKYNKSSYDQTKWYTIDFNVLDSYLPDASVQNEHIDGSQNEHIGTSNLNDSLNTDTNTDNNTEMNAHDKIFDLYRTTLSRNPKIPEIDKMGLLLKEYDFNTIKRTMKGIITELGWKCTVRQIEDVLKDPSKLNMYSKSDMVSYNWLLQQLNKDSSFDMTKYKPNKDKPKPDEEVWSLK